MLMVSSCRWPLSIRRVCARVYHIGGRTYFSSVSSSCFIDGPPHSPLWVRDQWSRMVVRFHRPSDERTAEQGEGEGTSLHHDDTEAELPLFKQTSASTVAITYFILMLLIGIVIFAYPKARNTHHDAFERTHRFLGWTATALVWAQVRDILFRFLIDCGSLTHNVRSSYSRTTTVFTGSRLVKPLCTLPHSGSL